MAQSTDSYGVSRELKVGDRSYRYYSLSALTEAGFDAIGQLPFSLKVLLENLLRGEDGTSRISVTPQCRALCSYDMSISTLGLSCDLAVREITGPSVVEQRSPLRESSGVRVRKAQRSPYHG